MRPHRIFIRHDKRFVPQPCHQKIVRAVFLIFADKIFVVFRIYVFQFRHVHRLFPSGISPGAAFLFRRRLHYAAISRLRRHFAIMQPFRRYIAVLLPFSLNCDFPGFGCSAAFLFSHFTAKPPQNQSFSSCLPRCFQPRYKNSARSRHPRKPPRSVSTSRAGKCARRRPAVPEPPPSGKPPPASCRRRPEPTPS